MEVKHKFLFVFILGVFIISFLILILNPLDFSITGFTIYENLEDTNQQAFIKFVIEIIKAEHLDENRNFISDIYDEVYQLDDIWSETISSGDYVRVTFEENLTNENDIIIYPRIVDGAPKIKVYEADKTEVIAEFTNIISDEYNKVFLTNLQGTQDVFDLLVLDGSLEFDYIFDPTEELWMDCSDYTGWTFNGWTGDPCISSKSTNDALEYASDFNIGGDDLANLTFEYDNKGLDGPGDFLRVEVTNDSGANWYNVLETSVNGPQNADIDLSTHITFTANCRVKFTCTSGNGEDCTVDNINITSYAPPDNEYPLFSAPTETPTDSPTYSSGATYEFNISIASTNGTAWIRFNNQNYSASNLTSTVFNWTTTDLSAGNYYYNWSAYGNGSQNNFNMSLNYDYTITKATGQVNLSLNGAEDNLTIQYPQESNITASTNYGTVIIYRDGTVITGENGLNVTRGGGYYNITAVSSGNQNYSSASKTYWLNITKAIPEGNLTNTTSWTIEYPKEVTIEYGVNNNGDGDLTYIVFRDDVSKTTGETITLGVGNYDYILNTTGGANYTANASMDAKTLTVNQNTTLQLGLTITPSQSETYGIQTTATESGCPAELTCNLYREHIEVSKPDTQTLGVTVYNYTYNTTGNENYSATSISKLLTINQATPTLTKYLNGFDDNLTIQYPQQLNASASSSGGTVKVYRGGNDVTNENKVNVTLGVDYYTYEFNVTGNQNYSDVSSVYLYANITQATAQTSLVFDKTSSQTYPTSINASCSVISGEGSAVLYRDEDDVTVTENNQDITLGVATYNYECNMSATQNYTSATNQSIFTIDQATGEINGTINGTQGNFTAVNGTANQNIYINATNITGDGTGKIYVNGTLYNSGTLPIYNLTNLSVGLYNITFEYDGNTNYTSDTEIWWVNVTEAVADSPPTTSIVYPGNTTYNTNVSELNYTASDDINLSACWYSTNEGATNSSPDTTCSNFTNIVSTEDSNTWTVYANDSTGQESSDSMTFFKDTVYPLIDYEPQTPADNSYLSQNYIYINVTWTEENFKNVTYKLYNSTGEANTTIYTSAIYEINWTSLPDENYTCNVTIVDTANNKNTTETRTITLDNTLPQISYNSNTDSTGFVNRDWIFINITASDLNKDSVGLEWGGVNETFDSSSGNLYWENKTGLSEGAYSFYAWTNDSSGNFNSTLTRTITIDTINPSVTSMTESPTDSATYSSGSTYEFNATITDTNLDTVLIEFDGTNYTASNLTADVYNFTIPDLAAGTYNYKWYANDSANNINLTGVQTYTINNATGNITLLINDSASDQTATYGTQTNASATTLYGAVTLYRNGEDVTGDNNNYVALGVGYYNYTASSSGDQNHSSATITRFVNITRISSEVNLTLNATQGNITITQDSSICLNVTTITGDSGATLKLYNNRTLINQGTSPLSNSTQFSTVGVFNITGVYEESQNYTRYSETWWVNVTQAPDLENPSVTSLTETPTGPENYSSGQTYEFNATITDNRNIFIVLIEFDGTNYTPSNLIGDVYNFTITDLAVGTYNYSWYANDTSGNVNNTENGTYIINQEIPSLNFTITPSTTELYETQTNATGSGCPSQLICKLYRDGIDVTATENGQNVTLGVDVYNYTYNTTGNANYSATSTSDLLNITKATGVVYTYLNNSRENITIYNDTFIWLNGTLEVGQAGENIELYKNGTLINQGISSLSNDTAFPQAGLYNITTIYDGNENYTSAYETWWINVTEKDITNPNISIIYPSNNTNTTNANIDINYTVSDNKAIDSCWYSNDTYSVNTSLGTGGSCVNITTITWSEGNHNVTVWANDTSGNENSSLVVFFVDSISPSFTKIKNIAIHKNSSLNYDIDANDTSDIDCFSINDTTNFNINCTGGLSNITGLSLKKYYVNITVNDTLGNENSRVIFINVVQINKNEFSGSTTDFLEIDDLSNITNLIIDNPEYGKINFTEEVNLENGTNLNNHVNISFNRIEINTSAVSSLNKSSTLYLYNLTFSNPRILRDGSVCPSTICIQNDYSGGTLSFNVTGFTVYSSEQTPSGESTPPSTSSSGGRSRIIECINDSECKGKYEVCWNHKCVKLFDIKIIDFESPVKLGEFFDFTYLIKGMADINGDVEVQFWIEQKGNVVTSGSDTIYLGSFEEKTEVTKMFLPSNLESGTYTFFTQVVHEKYQAKAHRIIEIEIKDGIAEITSIKKDFKIYIILFLICLVVLMGMRIIFKKRQIKSIKKYPIEQKSKKELKGKEKKIIYQIGTTLKNILNKIHMEYLRAKSQLILIISKYKTGKNNRQIEIIKNPPKEILRRKREKREIKKITTAEQIVKEVKEKDKKNRQRIELKPIKQTPIKILKKQPVNILKKKKEEVIIKKPEEKLREENVESIKEMFEEDEESEENQKDNSNKF